MAAAIAANPNAMKMPIGCTLLVWTPVVLMIVLGIVVVFLFTRD
jgi:hypothetical protein